MKNILIINGNPVENSFGSAIAKAYQKGAERRAFNVSLIDIRDLDFNPNLEGAYKHNYKMEPDIEKAIELLKNADHLVWVYPMWWYGMPALLKGFIDRTFLPDVAFKYKKGGLPIKLFTKKTARIIITSDTPRWFDFLYMKSPALNQMKKGILGFVGIKPVHYSYIAPIKHSSDLFRERWLKKIKDIGEEGM